MTATPSDPTPEPVIAELADAIASAIEFCDTHEGYNLPDLFSIALSDIAVALGGSHALVAHRSGSWEATHVQALAARADLQLDHCSNPSRRY